MMLNTTSFPAYIRSLHLNGAVTTRSGSMVAGPPRSVAELGVRLGLGPVFLDTPKTRSILANLGLDPGVMPVLARRLRSFRMWRPLWEDLCAPHLKAVEEALARGDQAQAVRALRTSLTMLGLAYGGDGYYVHTLLPDRRPILPIQRRLYEQLRAVTGERVERVPVPHARGQTVGLLHLPPQAASGPVPALVGIHQLAGDMNDFDVSLALFRAAGYATFCIDLPAHGENFDGPRIDPGDEQVAVAALEVLAARPEVDAARLGVIGGSLGAFFALKTAAASPRVKACIAYASPFDIGEGVKASVRGIRENFGWVVGARTRRETIEKAQPFHLRSGLGAIRCPVLLVHGTQDHICDFTASYEIARRVTAPLTVRPLVGVDHEAAMPSTPPIAGPALEWLGQNL